MSQIFTKLFIKDLSVSILFILGMYLIINNPVTHPTPEPSPHNWSIQLMQHPLLFGLAGHNYIVLRDNQQEIVEEVHGLPTDQKTNRWKYVGTNPNDILRVWRFYEPREYMAEKKYPGIVLYQGEKEQVLSLWKKTHECQEKINNKKIFYPSYGISFKNETTNSNSVAYTIALCVGLNTKHIGLITPGSTTNLLEE